MDLSQVTGERLAGSGEGKSAPDQRGVFIVLPAYNEASNLQAVVEELDRASTNAAALFHVIVVDDGSSDATSEIARRYQGSMRVTLIQHPSNLGLGMAVRSGILRAVGLAGERDVVVTMDADNTHTPGTIAMMIEGIDAGRDVVIASRYRRGAICCGIPLTRRLLSRAASFLFRILCPVQGVLDFTSGYRAYRVSALREALSRYGNGLFSQEGFQCMVDILLKMSRLGLRFGEVPIALRYDRKKGGSKMRVIRTSWKTLLLLVHRRFED